jgi:hypothetical protein
MRDSADLENGPNQLLFVLVLFPIHIQVVILTAPESWLDLQEPALELLLSSSYPFPLSLRYFLI